MRDVFGRRADRYSELDVFSEEQYYRPLFELAEIIRLLKENLDADLGGFQSVQVDGEMMLRWQTVIFAAVKQ